MIERRSDVARGARKPVYHTGFMTVIEIDGERTAVPCDEHGTPVPR